MGNKSSSTSRIENNTVVVNENDVKILDTKINDIITNSIINSAKVCSAAIAQLQNIKFEDVSAKEDINISTDQSQSAALSFDCVNQSELRNDISQEIINKIMTTLEESNNTKIVDTLNAIAQSKVSSSGIPSAIGSQADTNQTIITNTKTENISRTYINQEVQNSVCYNFTTNDIQSAITSVYNSQNVEFKNVSSSGSTVKIAMSQKQGAELMMKAIQKSNIGNKITTSLITDLELKKETTSTTDVDKKTSTEAKSEVESKDWVTNATDKVADFLSNLFAGKNSWLLWIIIAIVIIVVIFVIFKMKSKK